jgi:hypothetical protein
MKLEYVFVTVAIMLLFFPIIDCFVLVAKAELPDSWVNIEITSFNGDNISFNLQVTVQGNHLVDRISILLLSEESIQFWRAMSDRIYSEDTNTTVFSFDYTYSSSSSPHYDAGPKVPFLNLLLFPADSHSLVFYLMSTFNMTIDARPTACQVPSQNYQGSFTATQTSFDMLTVTISLNHSESFFLGVLGVLTATLVSLYGLTSYLALIISRKKSSNSSNIVTVSSAIIFFVPAFEIAFYSLKSPLPLVFSDILMIALIPLNALVIGFALGMSPIGVIIKLRRKFSSVRNTIQKARAKPQRQNS